MLRILTMNPRTFLKNEKPAMQASFLIGGS